MQGPPDDHEQFLRLLLRHEPMLRAGIRAVVQRSEDVDEIMQSVSLVAWRKFDSLTDPEGFGRWARVIARYEVLKFQRARARDRFVLDESLMDRILAEGIEESETSTRRLRLLERCLEKLPAPRRELLLQTYRSGCTLRSIAERLGRHENALYQMMRRLRLELRACIERGLTDEGGAA
jgi:RNA polymerase sigma-70 factor (ECF subfamily)